MENYVPVVSYAGRPDTILEQILIYVFPSYCIVSIICLLSLKWSLLRKTIKQSIILHDCISIRTIIYISNLSLFYAISK